MQIFVNNQPFDATLSGERSLAEVYDAIDQWTMDNKKYVLSVQVDAIEVPKSSLKDIQPEAVKRFDLYIGDEMDMVLSTTMELDRYLDQIGSSLFYTDSVQEKDIPHLKEGVHYIQQILSSVAAILRLDLAGSKLGDSADAKSVTETLSALLLQTDYFLQDNGKERIETFLADLRGIKHFVMKLNMQLQAMRAGIEELVESLEDFEKGIPSLVESIVKINTLFAQGKDKEALDIMEYVSVQLENSIAALYALDYRSVQESGEGLASIEIEGVTFIEKANALTALLRDLSSAFEEADLVAVGDILEYELTDRLKELLPYLALIKTNAKKG